MYLPTLQPVSNQVVGTLIAALIKRKRYTRASVPPKGDNDYRPPVYWLGGDAIPISVITQEVYQYQSEATKHAVESNVNFSDHVIQEPLRLEVEFEVSNYDGLGSNAEMAKESLDRAVAVWKGRQLFSFQTTHRMIDNVVCLALRVTNEAPQWGKLSFRGTFQEIHLVTLETSLFPTADVQGALALDASAPPPLGATEQGGQVNPKSNTDPAPRTKVTTKAVTDSTKLFPTPLTDNFFYGGR